MRPGRCIVLCGFIALSGGWVACASEPPHPAPPPSNGIRYEWVECPGFTVRDTLLTIGEHGLDARLPQNHRIVFPAGAAPEGSEYQVSRGVGGDVVGIAITPVGGAPSTFDPPISVRVNFAACGSSAPNSGAQVFNISTTPYEHMGGSQPAGKPWVTFETDHLTAFAIAD